MRLRPSAVGAWLQMPHSRDGPFTHLRGLQHMGKGAATPSVFFSCSLHISGVPQRCRGHGASTLRARRQTPSCSRTRSRRRPRRRSRAARRTRRKRRACSRQRVSQTALALVCVVVVYAVHPLHTPLVAQSRVFLATSAARAQGTLR